ncbi:nitroreductase family protein [Saccharothrix sp. AJ9571]|nr:nitroreductase family protein [Saccharothrix sp. AJ9571]
MHDSPAAEWFRLFDLRAHNRAEPDPAQCPKVDRLIAAVERVLLDPASPTGRTVPSAGAIFPYDLVLCVPPDLAGISGVFHLDLTTRSRLRLPVPAESVTRLFPHGAADQAHILVLSRPWLSMRKYGARGYLYAQLDTGHAATALLGLPGAQLRLGLPRADLGGLIGSALRHREVHSVVSFTVPSVVPGRGAWTALARPRPTEPTSDDLERLGWSMIPEQLASGGISWRPVSNAAPVPVGADDGAITGTEWPELATARRSCTSFADRPLAAERLIAALSALSTTMTTDVAATRSVRFTLLTDPATARECAPLADAIGIDIAGSARLGDPATVAAACNGQRHLGHARAFLVCRVVPTALPAGHSQAQAVRDALFRVSAAGHLAYLGAVRAGVAVTAVGGFRDDHVRALAGLAGHEEIPYLVAFGASGTATTKADRDERALAHGDR